MTKIFSYIIVIAIMSGCMQQQTENKKSETDITEAPGDTLVALNAIVHENIPLPLIFVNPIDNSEMVLIPGGEFIYGVSKEARDSILTMLETPLLSIFESELPSQEIYIPSYYIDKYEVTNKQYQKFLQETGHRSTRYSKNRIYNSPDQPVVGIGWKDAMAYAKWANKRLPTEEEWEKAARGTDGRTWPWGNMPASVNYNGRQAGKMRPIAVGSFPEGSSVYGIMDMAGNVYEMTSGTWGTDSKAMRGGSYLNAGAYTRTTFRWATDNEDTGAEYLGFRCVADTNIVYHNL